MARYFLILMACTLSFTAISMAQEKRKTILVDGSSTIAGAVRKAGAPFASQNSVGLTVDNKGAKVGIECALKKTCDVGMTSIKLSPEQSAKLNAVVVSYDGAGIIVSKDVTVDNLTAAQVKDIFEGKIKNWKEVGGADAPIQVWQRRKEGGIHDFFNKGIGITKVDIQMFGTNQEAINRIKVVKGGITYVAVGSVLSGKEPGVNVVGIDGVKPTPASLKDGSYKMKYDLYLVYHKDLASDPIISQFVDFVAKNIVVE